MLNVVTKSMNEDFIDKYVKDVPHFISWEAISYNIDKLSINFLREYQDKIMWNLEFVKKYVKNHSKLWKEFRHYYECLPMGRS